MQEFIFTLQDIQTAMIMKRGDSAPSFLALSKIPCYPKYVMPDLKRNDRYFWEFASVH